MNDMRKPSTMCGLIVLSFGWIASAGSAGAAMFNASNVAELISAIEAANQNIEADTITLSPGTTFTLTEVNNTTQGATGLPTIADSAALTIVGNGAKIERSTATETLPFRLFDVAAGASLTMENLTLQGGLGTDRGGAIYNEGILALDGVTVENNFARGRRGVTCRCRPGGNGGPGYGGVGGGIYSSGSLLLENSALLNNRAQGGGGGAGSPPGHSGRGGDGRGGGLLVAAGSATLYNSLVTGNSAVGGFGSPPGVAIGGGIYIAGGEVGIDEFTVAHITGNTATTNYPNIYGSYDLVPNLNPLPGDFNHDGTVDAGDYVVWRDSDGPPDGYDTWRANFGRTGAEAAGAHASVPEPSTLTLLLFAAVALVIPAQNPSFPRRREPPFHITALRAKIVAGIGWATSSVRWPVRNRDR
jgi:hypothetical protein